MFSYNDETFSYIVVVPLVSLYLIFLDREKIFTTEAETGTPGFGLLLLGVVLYLLSQWKTTGPPDTWYYCLTSLSVVAIWSGGLAVFYGVSALRQAAFPLAFLMFMAPIPVRILDPIVYLLQSGSAEVSYGVFNLLGIPIDRDGFIFHLPGLSIEVAKECSGIRSSLSLLLTSLIAGHLFLKKGWAKGVLAASIVPITIFKNGLRIVTLSLLAIYWDPRVLSGKLHQRGGILFFLLALLFLAGVLYVIRRIERHKTGGK